MRKILSCLALLSMFTGPLHAQAPQVESQVFVERVNEDEAVRTVEQIETLERGDRVVTVLRWDRAARQPFTITSAIPRSLAFETSSDENIEVSIDGGQTWRAHSGRINRQVTHVRWRTTRGSKGLTYSAIVR